MSNGAGIATRTRRWSNATSGNNGGLTTRLQLAAGLCIAAYIVHFAMTALFLAPVNPVSLDLHPGIHRYMGPTFQQNWQLFAPNPVNEERGLLVRARVRESDGRVRETEFHDFTSPLVQSLHATRLFPPRRPRMVSNTMQLLGFRDPIADRLRSRVDELRVEELARGGESVQSEDVEPLPLTSAEESVYRTATEVLREVGAAAARERWGDDVTEIQVRIVVNAFPRFSERHQNDERGDLVIQDVEWMDVRA